MCFSTCLYLVSDTKCCDFVGSYSIADGLYVEKYRTFCAGVFGEVKECYLTDSLHFRQKIGAYDEHEHFYVKKEGNKIMTYNYQEVSIPDTIEKKTLMKQELWKLHHSATNCLATIPIFGKNTIVCDNNFYLAYTYKTEDGYYIS
jgi:hypothetical protein